MPDPQGMHRRLRASGYALTQVVLVGFDEPSTAYNDVTSVLVLMVTDCGKMIVYSRESFA